MPNETAPTDKLDQLDSLLERWQTSLDLHAKYAALDNDRYWHVQPWPRHERPQRWIIQLARKRIIALKRIVGQRTVEGDRAFIEGIEIMGFLATLVGVTTMERFIPLATHETERRDVLSARPEGVQRAAPKAAGTGDAGRTRAPAPAKDTGRTAQHRRTAETTRQMPQLQNSRAFRAMAAQRASEPVESPAAAKKRDPQRPATVKPKKAPSTVTQLEHVVIADAVRLLGWGKQWHELAEVIGRLAERPSPSEIRRILRTYRDQIDAVATRRRE
jgi:hypothetical protein